MVKPASGKSSPERLPESSHSQYKGVRKRKWGKWVSEIRLPNSRERIWLGSYDSPVKAARAFDAALFCLRGRDAKFNFPENPPEISNGSSLTPTEIQAVAARFANGGLPSEAECSERPERTSQSVTENHHPPVSPPSSVSDGTVPAQSDPTMDWGFLDYVPDFGVFPGINEFPGDFLPPEPEVDYGDDEMDGGVFSQPLWNF